MTTRIRRRSFIARSNIFALFVFFVFGGGWVVDGLNSGMYYPSNFDEEKMLRFKRKTDRDRNERDLRRFERRKRVVL